MGAAVGDVSSVDSVGDYTAFMEHSVILWWGNGKEQEQQWGQEQEKEQDQDQDQGVFGFYFRQWINMMTIIGNLNPLSVDPGRVTQFACLISYDI